MSGWKHDALMNDLASYLRGPDRMVWEDMQLGPSGSPRPDVYTLQKSYSKPAPAAYECKVSRSDLRSDTTSGKWQSYLKYAGSVTFAVPDGLCTLADIPDSCGLIVRKAEVWRFARRPTIQRVTPTFDACMKLLIDGVSRVSTARVPQPRSISTWSENAAVRKRFGFAVEKAARDLLAVEQRIAGLKEQHAYEYDQIRKGAATERTRLLEQARKDAGQYEIAKTELCEWLGLSSTASSYEVQRAIASLKGECSADHRVQTAETTVANVRRTLQHALQAIGA